MSYPLEEFRHLVRRVGLAELPKGHRTWTGNDESQRNFNNRVSEDTAFVHLRWRRNGKAAVREVGAFQVNVTALAREGYLAHDPQGGIRLKFFHDHDGNPILPFKRF